MNSSWQKLEFGNVPKSKAQGKIVACTSTSTRLLASSSFSVEIRVLGLTLMLAHVYASLMNNRIKWL